MCQNRGCDAYEGLGPQATTQTCDEEEGKEEEMTEGTPEREVGTGCPQHREPRRKEEAGVALTRALRSLL